MILRDEDVAEPVRTKTYEHSGDTFLYVLGEPVHHDRDKDDVETMAANLRARFTAYMAAIAK